MVEILRNTPFRLAFILVPAIIAFFIGNRLKIDKYIYLLLLNAVASELFTLLHSGYNLVEFSLFNIIDVLLISYLIWTETRIKYIIHISSLLTLLAFIFFISTEYSSIDLFGLKNSFPIRTPLDTQQYFDFCSITNLLSIVLCFLWLYSLVNRLNLPEGGLTKRFIFLFGFLGYYAGSFFTLAFGRYIVGDITIWFEYWNKIYLPLYLLFYLTLNIGLLWKPAPAPSSS